MEKLYINIKARRNELQLTQTDLAKKLGYADKSMIAKIEAGSVDLSQSKILAFAEALNTTPSWLMGWDGDDRAPRSSGQPVPLSQSVPEAGVRIPVFGSVRAGIPLDAITDILDYEEIPQEMARGGEYFGLRVKGDSMLPDIREGDIVIVRQQPDVENGDTAIVLINGDEATVKRVMKSSSALTLIPANSQYAPMAFSMIDVVTMPVKILGKVVEIRRKL